MKLFITCFAVIDSIYLLFTLQAINFSASMAAHLQIIVCKYLNEFS